MTISRPAHLVRRGLLLATASVLFTGCVPIGKDGSDGEPVALQPQFGPASEDPSSPQPSASTTQSDSVTTSPTEPQPSTSTPPASEPTPSASAESSLPPKDGPPPPGPFRGTSTVDDDPDDRTATLEPSPDWADLEQITVTRDGDAMTIAVSLTGGAPSQAPDDDHTMNIATFFDVDGDGFIDYEVWANLNDSGWGTAWYDNVNETARFDADDDIEATVTGGVLTIAFTADKVASAERFRWATSSEYGRYETIGTDLMARDDAPDNDQPAHFPS